MHSIPSVPTVSIPILPNIPCTHTAHTCTLPAYSPITPAALTPQCPNSHCQPQTSLTSRSNRPGPQPAAPRRPRRRGRLRSWSASLPFLVNFSEVVRRSLAVSTGLQQTRAQGKERGYDWGLNCQSQVDTVITRKREVDCPKGCLLQHTHSQRGHREVCSLGYCCRLCCWAHTNPISSFDQEPLKA